MNGKLDTNWLGVPKEGSGFSNDDKVAFRAPLFSDRRGRFNGGALVAHGRCRADKPPPE
jgi:uncharacterized protein (DUF2141 family)